MIAYFNDCKQCAVCNNCGAKHTPHLVCNNCGSNMNDVLYSLVEDEFICYDCVLGELQDCVETVTSEDGSEHEVYVLDEEEYSSLSEIIETLECETLEDYKIKPM